MWFNLIQGSSSVTISSDGLIVKVLISQYGSWKYAQQIETGLAMCRHMLRDVNVASRASKKTTTYSRGTNYLHIT